MDYSKFISDLYKSMFQNKKSEPIEENILFAIFYQPYVKIVINEKPNPPAVLGRME